MADTSQIKEHMDVISSDKKTVGKVDHLEGADKIKLTRQSSPDGQHHHFIPVVVGGSCRSARAFEQVRRGCDVALAARTEVTSLRALRWSQIGVSSTPKGHVDDAG